jgi:plasmid stabilization system protein ParE
VRRARFIEAARRELLHEVAYYSGTQPGLGVQFAAAIEEAAARALAFPEAGSPGSVQTHRVILKRFPFSIFYRVEPDGILIFAIAHHAQRPGYWASRVR